MGRSFTDSYSFPAIARANAPSTGKSLFPSSMPRPVSLQDHPMTASRNLPELSDHRPHLRQQRAETTKGAARRLPPLPNQPRCLGDVVTHAGGDHVVCRLRIGEAGGAVGVDTLPGMTGQVAIHHRVLQTALGGRVEEA